MCIIYREAHGLQEILYVSTSERAIDLLSEVVHKDELDVLKQC